MNKKILKQLGFKKEVACVEKGLCPSCKKPVKLEFRDQPSFKEYTISGMCQSCQDAFFTS